MARTLQQWQELAACVISGGRSATTDEVGEACFEAERDGRQASIWHMHAELAGRTCNCVPCVSARDTYPSDGSQFGLGA